jgi:hypothetical protein
LQLYLARWRAIAAAFNTREEATYVPEQERESLSEQEIQYRDVDALRRAMIAFYRDYRPTAGRPLDIPTAESGVRVHNGKRYAVLDTATGVDVWRINNDGSLRRLVRWPREIDPKGNVKRWSARDVVIDWEFPPDLNR